MPSSVGNCIPSSSASGCCASYFCCQKSCQRKLLEMRRWPDRRFGEWQLDNWITSYIKSDALSNQRNVSTHTIMYVISSPLRSGSQASSWKALKGEATTKHHHLVLLLHLIFSKQLFESEVSSLYGQVLLHAWQKACSLEVFCLPQKKDCIRCY